MGSVSVAMVGVLTLLLYVGLLMLLLLHVWIVGRIFRRRRRNSMPHGRGLSAAELEKIPCFDHEVADSNPAECAVCLEGIQPGERCKAIPVCRHTFHVICVDTWLAKTPICPICRNIVGRKICVEDTSACRGRARSCTADLAATSDAELSITISHDRATGRDESARRTNRPSEEG